MGIAVISDLHLGARASTDLFGHDDAEFLKFLTFLEKNFERIVLLGDIWETLTSHAPRGHAEELRLAKERHREVAERFKRRMYTYVHGNHDWISAETDGAPTELALECAGVRLLFAHGHQSDSFVVNSRRIAEAAVWAGGWIRRAGMQAAYQVFDRLDRVRGRYESADCPSAVEAWAVNEARRRSAEVIVTGHTHHARRTEYGKEMFLNSGSCAEGRLSFLALEPSRGYYGVHNSY